MSHCSILLSCWISSLFLDLQKRKEMPGQFLVKCLYSFTEGEKITYTWYGYEVPKMIL